MYGLSQHECATCMRWQVTQPGCHKFSSTRLGCGKLRLAIPSLPIKLIQQTIKKFIKVVINLDMVISFRFYNCHTLYSVELLPILLQVWHKFSLYNATLYYCSTLQPVHCLFKTRYYRFLAKTNAVQTWKVWCHCFALSVFTVFWMQSRGPTRAHYENLIYSASWFFYTRNSISHLVFCIQ